MTELQFGLLGLGAVAVIGVAVYNTWQEYKHRKLAQHVLDAEHADVLLTPGGAAESAEAAERSGENQFQSAPDYAGNHPDIDREPDLEAPLAEPGEPLMRENLRENLREPRLASGERAPAERIEPVLRFDATPQEFALPQEAPEPEPTPAVIPESIADTLPEVAPETAPSIPREELAPAQLTPRHEESKENREGVEPLYLLSPVIDYVAAFDAVEPAPAYQILESQRDVLARIRKPIHWIGYNEFGREWEAIIDDGRSEYRRIRVGLQLVDRRGPLADNELSTFHIAMQDLADELMAIAEMPARQGALETAAGLDQFCASVDIQIGINVISSGQVFPGTKLRALAEAAGMVIDDEGRFVRCDDEGNVLYVMLNQEAAGFSVETMKTMSTHGITFLLDVPRVSHGERVFNQMVDLARRFADVLRGVLVDDNRRPLSEGALEPIRRQVGQYQSMMAARNLPAGGALAQRLFS
jgi:FtsZ-interacting cell division protein ZipA